MPKYCVTRPILVEGDLHQAGDELRCKSEGTIKAMLRVGQIVPVDEPVAEAPAAAPVPAPAKDADKPKSNKADK